MVPAPSNEMILVVLVGLYAVAYVVTGAVGGLWLRWKGHGGRLARERIAVLAAASYGASLSIFYFAGREGFYLPFPSYIVIAVAIGLLGVRYLEVYDRVAPTP